MLRRTAVTALLTVALAAPALAKPAHPASACVHTRIAGQDKCLRSGEYCTRAYERQYERYRFYCRRDGHVRYRLYR